MLKFLLFLPFALFPTAVFAFDRWVDDTYKNSETVYSTGIAQVLLVGARGVGIAINPNVEGHVISKDVLVTIDDKPPVVLPIQHVAVTTYLLIGEQNLSLSIATAKRVQISYKDNFILSVGRSPT